MRRGNYLQRVSFVYKEQPGAPYPPWLVQANDARALRLVLETKDRYYVLDQPYHAGSALLSRARCTASQRPMSALHACI